MSDRLIVLATEQRLLERQMHHIRRLAALREEEVIFDRRARLLELRALLQDLAVLSEQIASHSSALKSEAAALISAGAEARRLIDLAGDPSG